MKPSHRARFLALSLATLSPLLLQGCGGGGSDSGNDGDAVDSNTPALTLTPTATKTFAFSWSDVSDETEYRLLENPDGVSGYSEVAVIPANSTSYNLTVSLPQRINASYILQVCNNKGCTDSGEVFVSGSLAEAVGYFKASNTEYYGTFGFDVALSSDARVMAVGALLEKSGEGATSDDGIGEGAVYVFTNSNNRWAQQAHITASNAEEDDWFGRNLTLSSDGSLLAVAAPHEDSGATGIDGNQADNSASDAGAVYVFSNNGGSWTQQAYIKASNAEGGDNFGSSLALSGDAGVLAVGAYREGSGATGTNGDLADNSESYSGAVYLFSQSDGNWSQQAYIKASNTERQDGFGDSLALSSDGNVLAVGADSEDSKATGIDGVQTSNIKNSAGAVYVFNQVDGIWSQQAYIKASNTGANDRFGSSLALSGNGNLLVVGARGERSSATGIDGNQVDDAATHSGAAYVFTQSEGTWSQQAYIKASDTEENDWFGASLALSSDGSLLAVGAFGERSSSTGINGDEADTTADYSGAAYLFSERDGTWSQQAYIKASNTEEGDDFSALALSSDGSVLAVGAPFEDSSATGINGDQDDNSLSDSGAVYLY